ncbi:tubulin-specific protein, putative [Babesia ovis]|uniref:Tubulin-specific protein, putative n=1 Tax=Babesia ovis TaxID=5869 RepID=A0A9W5T9K5_BABOV|nr:tubulin-specific protein, putative [Babesia ovis]
MKRMHDLGFRDRIIKVELRHSQMPDRIWPEIRIHSGMTVGALKDKLYGNTGTLPGDMTLYAYAPYDIKGTQVLLQNDSVTLDVYGVDEGHVIYIVAANAACADTHSSSATMSHLSVTNSRLHSHYMEQLERCEETGGEVAFQKYQMSDEDYAARGHGLREFIARMRKQAGVDVPGEASTGTANIAELQQKYSVGSRCSVKPGDIRGSIRFAGLIKNKPMIGRFRFYAQNMLLGVELDEPMGTTDGTLGGTRYFTARGPRYGCFYSPENVEVGDFPELDPFDIA